MPHRAAREVDRGFAPARQAPSGSFSKGAPKEKPQSPGRKPGGGYGQQDVRAVPETIDERLTVACPLWCPDCEGRVRLAGKKSQYQIDLAPQRSGRGRHWSLRSSITGSARAYASRPGSSASRGSWQGEESGPASGSQKGHAPRVVCISARHLERRRRRRGLRGPREAGEGDLDLVFSPSHPNLREPLRVLKSKCHPRRRKSGGMESGRRAWMSN